MIVDAVQTGDFEQQRQDRYFQLHVSEAWKGTFDPKQFKCVTADGALKLGCNEHGLKLSSLGERVIVCFGRHNQIDGTFVRHNTAFVVNGGKIVYASTSDDDSNSPTEMTVDEFKARVCAVVAKQSSTTRSR